MSARPQRVRKPITTLANSQGRNAAEAAARAAARPKTAGPKTAGRQKKPQAAVVVNIARINVLPTGKGTLIPLLKILIGQVTSCHLYTYDAADELPSVCLGGLRLSTNTNT